MKAREGTFGGSGARRNDSRAESLARLFQDRSQSRMIRFDESVVPWTSPDHLDDRLTGRFLRDDVAATEDTLRKLRIVGDDPDGVARLTLAGALLCTPHPQQWLPHAQIQAVSYAGERHDVNYQNDARDLNGPLDEQIAEALHFVRRNMLVRATKVTARVERPQFGERAVFEALVNAVAHRDYSMAGARVRLHLFGNRLEMYVPGGLVNTLTPDSLHLRQANRNELIVSLLGAVSRAGGARALAPHGPARGRCSDHPEGESRAVGPRSPIHPDRRQRAAPDHLVGQRARAELIAQARHAADAGRVAGRSWSKRS